MLGAACAETGQTVGLLAPELSTRIVNAFFREFEKEVDPNGHVVMFWDGAGFHVSKDLKPPANVTLIKLPPYSPELNPIENLWHYLRAHHWSNRAYADDDDLRATCLDAQLARSVCHAPYLDHWRAVNV